MHSEEVQEKSLVHFGSYLPASDFPTHAVSGSGFYTDISTVEYLELFTY